MVNLDEIFPPLASNKKSVKQKDKKKFEKMRFLLFYALNCRMVNNYETIAVLLEYCPIEEGVDFLLNELMENNINNLFNGKIKHIEYFINADNKNKIKDLGKNFFGFINFIEAVLKQIEIYIN